MAPALLSVAWPVRQWVDVLERPFGAVFCLYRPQIPHNKKDANEK